MLSKIQFIWCPFRVFETLEYLQLGTSYFLASLICHYQTVDGQTHSKNNSIPVTTTNKLSPGLLTNIFFYSSSISFRLDVNTLKDFSRLRAYEITLPAHELLLQLAWYTYNKEAVGKETQSRHNFILDMYILSL